jgi:hypothetical protein
MGNYLDSQEYYQRRARHVKLCTLQRAYYAGFPYSHDPRELNTGVLDPKTIWAELFTPSDANDPPHYIDNIARTKIRGAVSDVWPHGSSVVFDGLEGELLERTLERLLNFANDYNSGIDGLDEWVEAACLDCAQTGDGLAFAQMIDGYIRYVFYGAEYWDMELVDGDAGWYRVEMKVKGKDGKTRIVRFDITRDGIRRYDDREITMTEMDTGVPPPEISPVATDPIYGGSAPTMHEIILTDPEAEPSAETKLIQQLSDWVCVPLRWQRLQQKDVRGMSELLYNDLQAADDMNRLMTSWKDAADGMGNPPCIYLDINEPVDENGNKIKMDSKSLGAGATLFSTSTDERGGKAFYPENPPKEAPYSSVLDRLRIAVMGNSPLTGPNAIDINRISELSAFARDTFEKVHRENVAKIRLRLFTNGIARLLKTGIEMLAIAGSVEGLTLEVARKVKVRFEYGGPMLSADEKVKGITYLAMAQKAGYPAAELVAIAPTEPVDRDALLAALEKKERDEEAYAKNMQAIASRPAVAPGQKPQESKTAAPSPEAASGSDKKAR